MTAPLDARLEPDPAAYTTSTTITPAPAARTDAAEVDDRPCLGMSKGELADAAVTQWVTTDSATPDLATDSTTTQETLLPAPSVLARQLDVTAVSALLFDDPAMADPLAEPNPDSPPSDAKTDAPAATSKSDESGSMSPGASGGSGAAGSPSAAGSEAGLAANGGSPSAPSGRGQSDPFAPFSFAPSNPAAARLASTTTLGMSPDPATFGSQVTYTAKVTGTGGTPTGNVTFREGATVLGTAALGASGTASLSIGALSVGEHIITGAYSGDGRFLASTNSFNDPITPASTTTTLTSSASPSILAHPVTFTARVASSAGTPGGRVTFFDGTTALATQTLTATGAATFTTSSLALGRHTLKATFTAAAAYSANFNGSTSAPLAQAVDQITAGNDTYSLLHDASFAVSADTGVLANDSSSLGLTLTATTASNPTHGTLTLNSDGSFTYVPNAGFVGADQFTYTANDGVTSATATVTLNVTDHAPTASAQTYSTIHDRPLTVDAATGLLNGSADADGDPLTVVTTPATAPQHGSLTLNADGSFVYTPNAAYVGTDSFQYVLNDRALNSAAATVTLNVTDNAPTAAALTYGVRANLPLTVSAARGLGTGAADADQDPLTFALVAGSGPTLGGVVVNADGSFTYTPANGLTGSDSFQYRLSDGALTATATVTLNVHATNTAPTASNVSYTAQHDRTLTVSAAGGLVGHSFDADGDLLTASLVGSTTAHGTLAINGDGSLTYAPNGQYTGTDTFQYRVNDGQADSNTATVTLNVVDASAPVANAVSFDVVHNRALTLAPSVLAKNATDADGDTLTGAPVAGTGPSHGQLTTNADGSYTYTPTTGFVGTDTFQATASDGIQTSAPATVTINVIDNPPTANDDAFTALQNTTLTVSSASVLFNDTDPDSDPLTAQLVTGAQHGTATLNANGTFSYTPNSSYLGTDTFTYQASDGWLTSSPATVTITVVASNSAPVAVNDSYSMAHGQPFSVDATQGVLANDSSPSGRPLWVQMVTPPAMSGLVLHQDGSFDVPAAPNAPGTDSFVYRVTDGINSNTATVTLTIIDPAPVAG